MEFLQSFEVARLPGRILVGKSLFAESRKPDLKDELRSCACGRGQRPAAHQATRGVLGARGPGQHVVSQF